MDEYHESERAPAGANGVRETPSTVRILADMRRCAYDLDFLISRQPRQVFGSRQLGPGVNKGSGDRVRTPAVSELEYLDVFDFFNMPRLPAAGGENGNGVAGGSTAEGSVGTGAEYQSFVDWRNMGDGGGTGNDWLVQG